MSKENPSPNWGGARKGAGRKALGDEERVTVYFRVNLSTKEAVYAEAESRGVSPGQLLDEIFKARRNG